LKLSHEPALACGLLYKAFILPNFQAMSLEIDIRKQAVDIQILNLKFGSLN
jgi:hypothetical protein